MIEQYGKSPIMFALEELKEFRALPVEEQRKALREHVEKELLLRELEDLL